MLKIKQYLIYIIVTTFPIMSIINFGGKFKFNTALSDAFIILFFASLILDVKNIKFKEFFKYWWYFIALIALPDLPSACRNRLYCISRVKPCRYRSYQLRYNLNRL